MLRTKYRLLVQETIRHRIPQNKVIPFNHFSYDHIDLNSSSNSSDFKISSHLAEVHLFTEPLFFCRDSARGGVSVPHGCSHRRRRQTYVHIYPRVRRTHDSLTPWERRNNHQQWRQSDRFTDGIATMDSTIDPNPTLAGPSNKPAGEPSLQPGSCATCRRRKVKCDKLPLCCSNCQRLGLQCEYAPRKRAPRKSRKADALSTREVELIKRLNKLEGELCSSTRNQDSC